MLAYVPVIIFVLVAISLPVVGLGVGRLIRPFKPSAAKLSPYECGVEPESDARGRISVRFYIIAVLFVVFDVETIFLFPWAVKYKMLGTLGFVTMFVFLGILLIGYAYAWKKGALEWV